LATGRQLAANGSFCKNILKWNECTLETRVTTI